MAISNYRAVLRSAVRGLWSGAIDAGQFDENMRLAISRYLTEAFAAGAKECGIKMDELTVDEQLVLADIISAETSHVGDFTAAVIANSKVNKGKLTPLFKRTDLWVNRYNDVKNQAKILTCKDAKLEWIYGDVNVHCSTCLKLHGKVKRASQWQASGIKPQNPPNPNLECGGWNCRCTLQPTDKPVSKGRLPRMSQTAGPGSGVGPAGGEGVEVVSNIADLSTEEKEVFRQYSGDYFSQINSKLRYDDSVSDEAQELIPKIDEVMEKISSSKDIKVYRGAEWYKLKDDDIIDMRDDLTVGTIFQDKGFISTSLDREQSEGFSGLIAPINYEISVPRGSKGLDISSISAIPEEKEFLLNRGTNFRIISIEKTGPDITDAWNVKMEVINE